MIKQLTESELAKASGGSTLDAPMPVQRFSPGDKVTLSVYPEYGIGTVQYVYWESDAWFCTVQFAAGTMSAYEEEFEPA